MNMRRLLLIKQEVYCFSPFQEICIHNSNINICNNFGRENYRLLPADERLTSAGILSMSIWIHAPSLTIILGLLITE